MATRDVVVKYRGSLGVWLGAVVVPGLVFGPGVVDDLTPDDMTQHVQAGAAVDGASGDPGNVTVTWTSNQNADNLTVRVEGPADVAGPTEARAVVLDDVGEAAVFEETVATDTNQTVTVHVEATGAGSEHVWRTDVVETEVTL